MPKSIHGLMENGIILSFNYYNMYDNSFDNPFGSSVLLLAKYHIIATA